MVILHNTDHYKYIEKQRKIDLIKYFNCVKKIYEGETIYLPKRLYEGDGIFKDINYFLSKNKDTISNIASTASSVADSIGKIGNTRIYTIKKIKYLTT